MVKYNAEKKDNEYIEISEDDAKMIIKNNNLTPSIITGGVNRYLGLPIEGSEVTEFSIKKR